MATSLELSHPQFVFLRGLKTKYRAFVGGYGSGKTFVGCLDLCTFFAEHPRTRQGYFGPSYPSIRDIFYPTFEEAANLLGFRVDIKESNKEVHVYRGANYYGTVICRSMDRPASIIGFKIARALVDEIDTLPKNKAGDAWNKIVARLRLVEHGVVNGIGVTTTPEGFMFVYSRFAEDPTASYSMVQASTVENEKHLPPDYIDTLRETYPDNLIQAYLEGKFVNLKSGTVYRSFNRLANCSYERIEEREPLFIGMDFNVGKMAACVFVKRPTGYHCVAEVKDGLDTPWMVGHIKETWPGSPISVFPDASGQNRTTKSAATSDIAILQAGGFSVYADNTNPAVKDRYQSVNKAFERNQIFVNTQACPQTTKCLEQQPFDENGVPDKKSGMDHHPDAFGYFVYSKFPIVKPYLLPTMRMTR